MIATAADRAKTTFAARLSDAQLASLVGAALFVATAWPIVLLDVPPYQDLPGHMATATVVMHLDRYPEYVFNGFLKTNSLLVAWLVFVGKAAGVKLAARLFVLGTLAANAFLMPRFVLHFTDRRRMLVASLFLAPMVHNWWVSMGMLAFALASAIALELVVQLDRQRTEPSWRRGAAVLLLALVTWYAHSIPVLLVMFLAMVQAATRPTWRDRATEARRMAPPLVPVALLVGWVMLHHASGTASPRAGTLVATEYEAPLNVFYNAWAYWFYGFTEATASSLVLAIVLAVLAARRWRESPPFFSPVAVAALIAVLFFLPSAMAGFGYSSVRVLPFLWMAALLRLPATLPRALARTLAVAAALYVVGLALDLFLVERDTRAFTAGIDAVPEGSRLLTLNFATRVTSKNTWSLHTASGLYTVAKLTTAQDVWADSPTMPIMHASPPDALSDAVAIRRFVGTMESRRTFCERDGSRDVSNVPCEERWRELWTDFWSRATPRFDHLLLWSATEDATSMVPPAYRLTFERGRLRIYERIEPK